MKINVSSPPSTAGKRGQEFLRLATVKRDRIGRTGIGGFSGQEIGHVGTRSRDAQKTGTLSHQLVDVFDRHPFFPE